MKNEKKLLGFSFYINIGNFEAFLWSAKHLFWRCDPKSLFSESYRQSGLYFDVDYVRLGD